MKPISSRTIRMLAAAAALGSTAIALQGCVGLAVGTAVVGTLAAVDRRTLGAQAEDKEIVVKGESRIARFLNGAGHVNVTSYDRKILLTGEVPDEATKQGVGRVAADIEGVQSVVNELAISGSSSLTSRSNDALITGKVKASLVDTRDLSAGLFKVVTERGIVYLMGRVTQREGDMAAEVARNVPGVQQVIKVFEYISDDDAKQYSKPAAGTL